MAQIAKAAGVSQGAISSLLNDRDYGIRVSEKHWNASSRSAVRWGDIPNDLRAVVRMYPELGDFCLLFTTRRSAGVSDPFVMRIAAAMDALPDTSRALSIGIATRTSRLFRSGSTSPASQTGSCCVEISYLRRCQRVADPCAFAPRMAGSLPRLRRADRWCGEFRAPLRTSIAPRPRTFVQTRSPAYRDCLGTLWKH